MWFCFIKQLYSVLDLTTGTSVQLFLSCLIKQRWSNMCCVVHSYAPKHQIKSNKNLLHSHLSKWCSYKWYGHLCFLQTNHIRCHRSAARWHSAMVDTPALIEFLVSRLNLSNESDVLFDLLFTTLTCWVQWRKYSKQHVSSIQKKNSLLPCGHPACLTINRY